MYVDQLVRDKIRNLQSGILDYLIYIMTRNTKNYKINSRIDTYAIESKELATLKTIADIRVLKNPDDFCYIDSFQWEQDEKFQIETEPDYQWSLEEDLNWTKVTIKPKSFILQKREEKKIPYKVKNLNITSLKRHSFLSCNPKDKIKTLMIVARVNKDLKPNAHAKYIIQNKDGDVIHTEELPYDFHSQSYEKIIKYPRKSRKYIIKWDYSE